jgi:hypothetical protein
MGTWGSETTEDIIAKGHRMWVRLKITGTHTGVIDYEGFSDEVK